MTKLRDKIRVWFFQHIILLKLSQSCRVLKSQAFVYVSLEQKASILSQFWLSIFYSIQLLQNSKTFQISLCNCFLFLTLRLHFADINWLLSELDLISSDILDFLKESIFWQIRLISLSKMLSKTKVSLVPILGHIGTLLNHKTFGDGTAIQEQLQVY